MLTRPFLADICTLTRGLEMLCQQVLEFQQARRTQLGGRRQPSTVDRRSIRFGRNLWLAIAPDGVFDHTNRPTTRNRLTSQRLLA